MTAAISNLVKQTTTTTGTGNLTLTTNSAGFVDFSTAHGTGSTTDVFYYHISNGSAVEWEVGTGHMSASQTFVRDTIIASSNSGSAVNFSAGTKTVVNNVDAGWLQRTTIGRMVAAMGGVI